MHREFHGKANWQVIARIIDQGSWLSAVRLASRTRGHVFVVMLAYRIVQELANQWNQINLTVAERIDELTTLCATEMLVNVNPVAKLFVERLLQMKGM